MSHDEKYNDCPHCQGRTWTCEAHPDQPFEHLLQDGTECPGPGVPCETCGDGIKFEDGIKVFMADDGYYDYLPVSRR